MKNKILIAVALLMFAGSFPAAEVMVFAAASLTDALKQIGAEYKKNSEDKIVFNFAVSGPLARQIEAGAPADIFISADEARADALAAKGLLVNESRRNLLGNTLVIISAPDNATIHTPTLWTWRDLSRMDTVLACQVESVVKVSRR